MTDRFEKALEEMQCEKTGRERMFADYRVENVGATEDMISRATEKNSKN